VAAAPAPRDALHNVRTAGRADLRLWTYRYEGAMLRYLQSWIGELRWQRLAPFQKLAHMLVDHLDGILNYCLTKVRFGVVGAINGNIKTLLRRGRG
jgi:transposase